MVFIMSKAIDIIMYLIVGLFIGFIGALVGLIFLEDSNWFYDFLTGFFVGDILWFFVTKFGMNGYDGTGADDLSYYD